MVVNAAKAREAAEVLEVELDGLTSNALSSAYRSKAKECHPDHHGSDKLHHWSRVSWAKECLERWLKSHPAPVEQPVGNSVGDCRACAGTGRVPIKRASGFNKPMTMLCILCKGTGSMADEDRYTGGED